MPEQSKWYVVHTYSGYENKVATNIKNVVENRMMEDEIIDVIVPTETVTEIKDEETREVERKIFPGYVLVKVNVVYNKTSKMYEMNDETWYIIRNTRGVTGFVGSGNKPVPLSEEEVAQLGVEKHVVEVNYKIGDFVTVSGGPFDGFSGTVEKLDIDKNFVEVNISMFGRDTPVEFELHQVHIANEE